MPTQTTTQIQDLQQVELLSKCNALNERFDIVQKILYHVQDEFDALQLKLYQHVHNGSGAVCIPVNTRTAQRAAEL